MLPAFSWKNTISGLEAASAGGQPRQLSSQAWSLVPSAAVNHTSCGWVGGWVVR